METAPLALTPDIQRHPARHRHRGNRRIQQPGAQNTVVRPLLCPFTPCDGESGKRRLIREGVDPPDTAELRGQRGAVLPERQQHGRTPEFAQQGGGFASAEAACLVLLWLLCARLLLGPVQALALVLVLRRSVGRGRTRGRADGRARGRASGRAHRRAPLVLASTSSM
ncbi:hypothetical protein [Streptomyces sp. NBC_00286]|uniref:hypothetical protein n=1 Tax=Streptomyces sp. NBC_00286 TaxID=2975701 RepID=UPI003FA6D507